MGLRSAKPEGVDGRCERQEGGIDLGPGPGADGLKMTGAPSGDGPGDGARGRLELRPTPTPSPGEEARPPADQVAACEAYDPAPPPPPPPPRLSS